MKKYTDSEQLAGKKIQRIRLQPIQIDEQLTQKQKTALNKVQMFTREEEEDFLSFPSTFDEQTQPFPVIIDEQTKPLLKAVVSGEQGAQGYIALISNLMKNSGVYALGSMASPLISLILAPFLTRNLSQTDYGAFAVLSTVITLLAAITQIGISTAFFRAYNHDYELERDRLHVLSTSVILMTVVSIPVSLVLVIIAPWVAAKMFGNPSFTDALRLGAAIILLQNLAAPGIAWLRSEKRAVASSLLAVANPLVTLVTTLILMGLLHMGLTGAFLAITAGYAIVIICVLPVMIAKAGFYLDIEILKNLLTFGGPIIFTSIAVWILQVSDRGLLSYYTSLAQTGMYSVAYSLGGVLAPIIIGPFGLAWPPIMYMIAKRDDAAQIFQLVFRWFSFVLFFAAFGLSVLATLMLYLLFPSSYHSASSLIPFITGGLMFYGLYNFVILGAYIRRKTSMTAILTIVAALGNLGLNIILIPHYGALGAAISTLAAYMLLAIIAYFINQRIYPIKFEIGLATLGLLIGVALYLGCNFLLPMPATPVGFGISLVVVLFYGGGLFALGQFAGRNHKKKYRAV